MFQQKRRRREARWKSSCPGPAGCGPGPGRREAARSAAPWKGPAPGRIRRGGTAPPDRSAPQIRSRCSGGMPMPLSSTSSRTDVSCRERRTSMYPFSRPYLRALSSRLPTTRDSRNGSAFRNRSSSGFCRRREMPRGHGILFLADHRNHFAEIDGFPAETLGAQIQTGHVQQTLDQQRHFAGLPPDDGDGFPVFFQSVGPFFRVVALGQDDGSRGAQLVGGVGSELLFRFKRLFQPPQTCGQRNWPAAPPRRRGAEGRCAGSGPVLRGCCRRHR